LLTPLFQIGDCVFLKNEQMVMQGDGVLLNKLMSIDSAVGGSDMNECVFELCVTSRKSAAEALQKFMHKKCNIPVHLLKEKDRRRMDTLQSLARKEGDLNGKLMEERMGKPIVYGDIIQLKHIRSGKYITTTTTVRSLGEPANFENSLMEVAGDLSWYTVMPAKAFNEVGANVTNESGVLLMVSNFDDAYLHMANFTSPADFGQPFREVNTSLMPTPWKLCLYCSYKESNLRHQEFICIGDIIQLLDPEADAYLESGEEGSLSLAECKKVGEESIIHSGAYFEVEKEGADIGGFAHTNDRLILRNLNTGCPMQLLEVTSAMGEQKRTLICREAGPKEKAMPVSMYFESLKTDDRVGLRNKYPIRMCATAAAQSIDETTEPLYLRCDNNSNVGIVDVVDNPEFCCPVLIQKEHISRVSELYFGLRIREILTEVIHDMKVGMDALRGQFNKDGGDDIANPQKEQAWGVSPKEEEGRKVLDNPLYLSIRLQVAIPIVKRIERFVCTCEEDAKLTAWGVDTKPSRQRLVREQGVLELLLLMVGQLGRVIKALAIINKMVQGVHVNFLQQSVLATTNLAHKLLACIFRTLHASMIGSTENKIEAEAKLDILLDNMHCPAAWSCLIELLQCPTALERITHKTVNKLVQQMGKHQLKAVVLDMLKTLCSFEGNAIVENQLALSEFVFTNQSTKSRFVELVPPSQPGGQLMFRFPDMDMTAEELMGGSGGMWKAKKVLRKNFLVSQLLLFAEMCCGRNYQNMTVISQMVPLDVLIDCLGNKVIPTDVRAAFVRLCACVYIDRLPHVPRRWQNLTFVQTETGIEPIQLNQTQRSLARSSLSSLQRKDPEKSLEVANRKDSSAFLTVQLNASRARKQSISVDIVRGLSTREIERLQQVISEELDKFKWMGTTAYMAKLMCLLLNFSAYDNKEDELGRYVLAYLPMYLRTPTYITNHL
jgi:hypothetical protein